MTLTFPLLVLLIVCGLLLNAFGKDKAAAVGYVMYAGAYLALCFYLAGKAVSL